MKPKMLVMSGLFAALIAVGAFLRIPLPQVPITLQTLFVLLAGLLLPKAYAPLPSLIYLLLGLLGLPIFTGGGGIGYLLHPTFGYLLGFVAAGWVMGRIATETKFFRLLLAALAGLAVIYLFGTIYYYAVAVWYLGGNLTIASLLSVCILTSLPADLIKAVLAAVLAKRLKQYI